MNQRVHQGPPVERDLVAWGWANGELSWKFHDAQLVVYEALKHLPPHIKEAVMLCCRRFGKSFFGVVFANERCLKKDMRRLIRIVGPDIKQTVGIVEDAMAKITVDLHSVGMKYLVRRIKSEKRWDIGDSSLFLGGFDSQEDNLRGGEAHEIYVEETGFSDPERYDYQMKSVLKPQLLKTRGRMIHLTTLPEENDHPFITETIPEAQLNGAFYSFDIYQDPLATPEIIADAIKDSGGVHSITFQREYLNRVVRDKTLVVVPTYDDMLDVEEFREVPYESIWSVFIDQGGTRDKTVALLMTYIFDDDVDWVEDEKVWDNNTPSSEITKDLKLWDADFKISHRVSDCSGQTQIDWGTDHDYTITKPQKGDWQANVNRLITRHSLRKMRINKKCTFLRTSLNSGRLTKDRKDFQRTKALGHCDGIATLMYGNQCLDRSCPFPAMLTAPTATRIVIPKAKPQDMELVNAIAPRTFGNPRKGFGKF